MKAGQPMNLERFTELLLKHSTWLLIAWWTGGAWVLYFADAPTLVYKLATFQGEPIAYIWIAILTFTTYFLAGFMREQVCTYMCPWPRIQAALIDEWALNVTYRYDRGEPRGSLKKNESLRLAGSKSGDCVDCHQCVNVCPTGVDIRDGLQIDCIQCGLCIDACDNIMTRIGRPTGLIGYDTQINVERRNEGLPAPPVKIIRPRTVLYAVLIAAVGAIMLYALTTRSMIEIAALHDRNPQYVTLSDGSIRNGYALHLVNRQAEERRFLVGAEGLKGAKIESAGLATDAAGRLVVSVGRDQTLELRVLITVPTNFSREAKSQNVVIRAVDPVSGAIATVSEHFFLP